MIEVAEKKEGIFEIEEAQDISEDTEEISEIERILQETQEEISQAIEAVVMEAEISAEVEELLVFEQEKPEEAIVRYESEDELKVDYENLYSYLNTRPNEARFDYAFSANEQTESDELNFEVLEKLNRARKMEKTIHSAERSFIIPEGFSPETLERFDIYRKTAAGAALNQILYEIAFS